MAKIQLSEPQCLYSATLDTEVCDVEIKEAFLGIGFVAESGERLSVCMRDSGFELRYEVDGPDGLMYATVELKEGLVKSGTFRKVDPNDNNRSDSADQRPGAG